MLRHVLKVSHEHMKHVEKVHVCANVFGDEFLLILSVVSPVSWRQSRLKCIMALGAVQFVASWLR